MTKNEIEEQGERIHGGGGYWLREEEGILLTEDQRTNRFGGLSVVATRDNLNMAAGNRQVD